MIREAGETEREIQRVEKIVKDERDNIQNLIRSPPRIPLAREPEKHKRSSTHADLFCSESRQEVYRVSHLLLFLPEYVRCGDAVGRARARYCTRAP